MVLKKVAMIALAALGLAGLSQAQSVTDTLSSVSIYGGGNFVRLRTDDGYDYYDDSDTYSGVMEGAEITLVAPIGLMFDVSAENARASLDGVAFKEQQLMAGVGFTTRLWNGSSWYAQGFYEHYRVGLDEFGCDYNCNGWYAADGGGVKGGFRWPFAGNWFGAVNASAAYLSFHDVDGWQGRVDGSIGYLFSEHASISVGVASQATGENDRHYDRNYDRYYDDYYDQTTSLNRFNVFAKFGWHF